MDEWQRNHQQSPILGCWDGNKITFSRELMFMELTCKTPPHRHKMQPLPLRVCNKSRNTHVIIEFSLSLLLFMALLISYKKDEIKLQEWKTNYKTLVLILSYRFLEDSCILSSSFYLLTRQKVICTQVLGWIILKQRLKTPTWALCLCQSIPWQGLVEQTRHTIAGIGIQWPWDCHHAQAASFSETVFQTGLWSIINQINFIR